MNTWGALSHSLVIVLTIAVATALIAGVAAALTRPEPRDE